MQIIRWQGSDLPQEHELRKKMQQQGLSPYMWSNAPEYHYAAHTHSYEKILYCVRGSICFQLPDHFDEPDGGVIELGPGDCMLLPAGIRHSAQVGSEGVVCLEAARHSTSRTA